MVLHYGMTTHDSSSEPTPKPIIIGIDLGTTNSLVAYCDHTGPRCIADDQGRHLLPSVVRLSQVDGSPQALGFEAREHAVEHPTNTVYSIKRLMGRGLSDAADELPHLPYKVQAGENDTARVRIGDRLISPPEISAMILQELSRRAEAHFGQPVRKAVITVPAYFDDAQRQATRDAGRIAGLEVVRMVNEPTAAALAYNLGLRPTRQQGIVSTSASTALMPGCPSGEHKGGLLPMVGAGSPAPAEQQRDASTNDSSPHHDTIVAVFDLGGGTFDFSILRLQATESGVVDQVLGTAGDTHLGGDDVDRMIIELVQSEIRQQFGQSLQFPPATLQALRNFAEATKIKLSDSESATIEIQLGADRVYRRTLTRSELETMMQPWLERALSCCRRALQAAKLATTDIEKVIMVGGSTRIPLVRQQVRASFGSEPYTALNPDEVVALGAAVQGAILAGVQRDMLLLDVIPLSLGIETMGGAVAKVIVANSTIPARATEKFTTYVDGQTTVKIHVLQGERELVKDCRSLGQFELRGIPPMPAGLPKIEVTFLVDASGILNVSAIEQRSGKAAGIQVVPHHGLSRDEVARIEAASLQHARDDMLAHRRIDLRNQARLDIRNITRQLERVGAQLPAQQRLVIDQHIARVQQLADDASAHPDVFQKALHELDHATLQLAELAIKQTLTQEGLM